MASITCVLDRLLRQFTLQQTHSLRTMFQRYFMTTRYD